MPRCTLGSSHDPRAQLLLLIPHGCRAAGPDALDPGPAPDFLPSGPYHQWFGFIRDKRSDDRRCIERWKS
jgi:hypothetical protein